MLLALLAACGSPVEADAVPPGTAAGVVETDAGFAAPAADGATLPRHDDCDGVDDDGDGAVDEDATWSFWWWDGDRDGYGDPETWVYACARPDDTVPSPEDCDDGDGDVHPGAADDCDGVDQNCDGSEPCPAGDPTSWMAEVQGSGCYALQDAAPAGDLTGDDVPDLLLGVHASDPTCDGGAGYAMVVAGRHAGTYTVFGPATRWLEGEYGGAWSQEDGRMADVDLAGGSVAGGMDVDGDGRADLAVGAPGANGAAAGSDHGAVYLVTGPLGSTGDLAGVATTRWLGAEGERLGLALAGGADLTGDGTPDLIAATEAAWYVLDGTDRGEVALPGHAPRLAPASVGGDRTPALGDFDGDGVEDLVLPAGGDGALLFSGPLSARASIRDAELTLAPGGSRTRVTGGADADGDGHADLVVGGLDGGGNGRLHLFAGPLGPDAALEDAVATLDVALHGDAPDRATLQGDVDGDGRADLLVVDSAAARVRAYRGPLAGTLLPLDADAELVAPAWVDRAFVVGDLGDDGRDDVLAGTAGALWLYEGGLFAR